MLEEAVLEEAVARDLTLTHPTSPHTTYHEGGQEPGGGVFDGPGHNQHHATVRRPWGSFTVLEEGKGYKIKRIEVMPNHRLSLQMHHHRSEHWIVVSGTAKVTCGDREILISSNESTYVPRCTPHRLANPGMIPLIIIEVQNGEYLGEDDIIRFQDDYARANPLENGR